MIFNNEASSQIDDIKSISITQGYIIKLGLDANGGMSEISDERITCEYPEGSLIEHVYGGIGLWVGALIDTSRTVSPQYAKAVTTTNTFDLTMSCGLSSGETIVVDTSHPWYFTSVLYTDKPNKRFFDDDGDGMIDEDELDGIDNDGDGKIDEDYGAVSESDYYCGYADNLYPECYEMHRPIGIKVWQRSYAWSRSIRIPIIIIEYNIVNLGINKLSDVYIGIHIPAYVSPLNVLHAPSHVTGYWPELRTSYYHNLIDRGTTPLGITLLEIPKNSENSKFIYRVLEYDDFWSKVNGERDQFRYDLMSGSNPPGLPDIQPNTMEQYHIPNGVFSFGPINNWDEGDTLKFAFAIVCGQSIEIGQNNLYDNAKFAQTLYARNYVPPYVLPAPPLTVEPGFQRVNLRWQSQIPKENPEEVWDDESQSVKLYPEDSWRRLNPPEGHTMGGRIFEGYRLYRSEDPGGAASSFVMLKQWDIKDSVGPEYGYGTGLEYEYVDSNLHTGKNYWYSVTSYGIPDVQKMEYLDFDGSIKETILESEGKESYVLGSRKRVRLPFSVSNELGKVLVVPNPYRVDADYTLEFGGYEGRSRSWNENKRILKFTHLPPICTIRIFTLGGDIVATLHHENQTIGEYDWNMLSESNRAIASGVYVYTVESEYGTQTGKFVVIR